MVYFLYNPQSQNGMAQQIVDKEVSKCEEKPTLINVLELNDYSSFISSLTETDEICIFGGDGTLNHFINNINNLKIPCNVYFYACGTGNDFFHDLEKNPENGKILINDYILDLPIVTVNGKEYRFINGVGFGIDGYCCEEGDRLKSKSSKPVNYTSIAIKGLLFKFKTPSAKITIDGVTKVYKKVWLAPTMKGRFYGGGMMVAPNQKRTSGQKEVSLVVFHDSGKLKTLMMFPSIFKGELIKKTKYCEVMTGHNIEVEFNRPTALQIDGETIKNVTKYSVRTNNEVTND